MMTLWEVAAEISRRLSHVFLKDDEGRRACHGGVPQYQTDPHWRDLILFYEYFHGENGTGLGASHQTGWTGLVAKLLQQSGDHTSASGTALSPVNAGLLARLSDIGPKRLWNRPASRPFGIAVAQTDTVSLSVMKRPFPFLLLAAGLWSAAISAQQVLHWQIGPFARPAKAVPVIAPNRNSIFRDPVEGKTVHWEALHRRSIPQPSCATAKSTSFTARRTTPAKCVSACTRLDWAWRKARMASTSSRPPEPVLYPSNDSEKDREWPGGCEDPRIVETADGTYVLTYTQWNRKKTDIGIATSKDLVHWTKHGPALGTDGKYGALSYNSAGIVTRMEGGHRSPRESAASTGCIGGKASSAWQLRTT